jgi:hypothetical protein
MVVEELRQDTLSSLFSSVVLTRIEVPLYDLGEQLYEIKRFNFFCFKALNNMLFC